MKIVDWEKVKVKILGRKILGKSLNLIKPVYEEGNKKFIIIENKRIKVK